MVLDLKGSNTYHNEYSSGRKITYLYEAYFKRKFEGLYLPWSWMEFYIMGLILVHDRRQDFELRPEPKLRPKNRSLRPKAPAGVYSSNDIANIRAISQMLKSNSL